MCIYDYAKSHCRQNSFDYLATQSSAELLLFEEATFLQSSYTFLQDLFFQKMMFVGTLVFTVILFLYHLVTNPTNINVFRHGMRRVVQHSENLPI